MNYKDFLPATISVRGIEPRLDRLKVDSFIQLSYTLTFNYFKIIILISNRFELLTWKTTLDLQSNALDQLSYEILFL